MSTLKITAKWKITTSLHIGTGGARAGFIDSLARRSAAGLPEIPGDAVKGAIRQSAERLSRWVCGQGLPAEDKENSLPAHPALRRIFAPESLPATKRPAALYRFRAAESHDEGARRFLAASTAIANETGVAQGESLRIFEHWARGLTFGIEVQARGGNWKVGEEQTGDNDRSDLEVLCMAVALTDSIGGKRGAGCGAIEIEPETFKCENADISIQPADEEFTARVWNYLARRRSGNGA